MNTRDFDYIEARLLNPADGAAEATGRLRQVGRDDLADRILEAHRVFLDECRAVRAEIWGQRGT